MSRPKIQLTLPDGEIINYIAQDERLDSRNIRIAGRTVEQVMRALNWCEAQSLGGLEKIWQQGFDAGLKYTQSLEVKS